MNDIREGLESAVRDHETFNDCRISGIPFAGCWCDDARKILSAPASDAREVGIIKEAIGSIETNLDEIESEIVGGPNRVQVLDIRAALDRIDAALLASRQGEAGDSSRKMTEIIRKHLNENVLGWEEDKGMRLAIQAIYDDILPLLLPAPSETAPEGGEDGLASLARTIVFICLGSLSSNGRYIDAVHTALVKHDVARAPRPEASGET